jgi:dienelactone hydrolase
LVDLGDQADSRNEYWGFDPTIFPLNGRVWYPEGVGPFPLVLVVHGNHDPKDFSDPGYDYLGELLASRGYIMASIDMNFVNGGIRQENDARGWLLLKHLQVWDEINQDPENIFFHSIDMDNIALIGHSRGGEAVGHAAAFNKLSHYPDDANLTFDFGFNIRAIVAIAPVGGQYLPTGRFVPVENVNYMVFHGSHDGDVTAFQGLRLYHRLRFTDGNNYFKTAIYVYRANHGQWNSSWGSHDSGPRSDRILDLRGLLDPEEQKEFAKIYISSFLEYSLKQNEQFLPLFRDHRVAGGWLPKTMYITRFQEQSFKPLATFEEDIDVTTGTAVGVHLKGNGLAVWKEQIMPLRSRNRATTSASQVNQSVWLGWDNEDSELDASENPASFSISLPDTLGNSWDLTGDAHLQMALTPTLDEAKSKAGDSDNSGGSQATGRAMGKEEDPLDVTVEVRDALGRSATLILSDYGVIRPPLQMDILRRRDIEKRDYEQNYEFVLQTFSIPLSDFIEQNSELEIRRLSAIRLVFDATIKGSVIVDDIGISFLDEAFTAESMKDG